MPFAVNEMGGKEPEVAHARRRTHLCPHVHAQASAVTEHPGCGGRGSGWAWWLPFYGFWSGDRDHNQPQVTDLQELPGAVGSRGLLSSGPACTSLGLCPHFSSMGSARLSCLLTLHVAQRVASLGNKGDDSPC